MGYLEFPSPCIRAQARTVDILMANERRSQTANYGNIVSATPFGTWVIGGEKKKEDKS